MDSNEVHQHENQEKLLIQMYPSQYSRLMYLKIKVFYLDSVCICYKIMWAVAYFHLFEFRFKSFVLKVGYIRLYSLFSCLMHIMLLPLCTLTTQ